MVSIIIPYYNRPNKLTRCLLSIHNQTYTNFEIIVVDDCSKIPLSIAHEKVTCIRNDKNMGPGGSRNVGMQHAQGTYIAFLDCDDYWAPTFLRTMVDLLEEHQLVVMAFANAYVIGATQEIMGIRRKKERLVENILPEILQGGRAWGTGGCVWRLAVIKEVSWLSTRVWEDYAFDISVALLNNKVIGTTEKLVYYDASGEDKISNQKTPNALSEKATSLVHVSKLLRESAYAKNRTISKMVSLHLVNSILALWNGGGAGKPILKQLRKELHQWNYRYVSFVVRPVFMMRPGLGVPLLRKIRKVIFS